MGRSVSQHIVPMRCIITLFQKCMQKVYAVISRFWRICDFGVYATIQIGRFQSGIFEFQCTKYFVDYMHTR